MITITATDYYNDLDKKVITKSFTGLDSLYFYLKDISIDFQSGYNGTQTYWFPKPKDNNYEWCGRIEVRNRKAENAHGNWRDLWIHKIESDAGIIYSDGKFTERQKFASKSVIDWLAMCNDRAKNKSFNFVDE